jgi:hypothetical protein
MQSESDPYWRLRPPGATPVEDVCHCANLIAVILLNGLTYNPLCCIACKGEIPPERIGFDESLAEVIAFWLSVYDSLYRLWLDSGEYETWAAERLSDPSGSINREGREIVARLNEFVPAYYWWFVNSETDDQEIARPCPVCAGRLERFPKTNLQLCPVCRIVLEAGSGEEGG